MCAFRTSQALMMCAFRTSQALMMCAFRTSQAFIMCAFRISQAFITCALRTSQALMTREHSLCDSCTQNDPRLDRRKSHSAWINAQMDIRSAFVICIQMTAGKIREPPSPRFSAAVTPAVSDVDDDDADSEDERKELNIPRDRLHEKTNILNMTQAWTISDSSPKVEHVTFNV